MRRTSRMVVNRNEYKMTIHFQYYLMAPTGRAAKRMSESTGTSGIHNSSIARNGTAEGFASK